MIGGLKAGIGIARSLLVYHGLPWRVMAMRRFMRELVGPGALAFDIGAHAGNRSLALAKAGARVVAFEPQPAFFAILERIAAKRPIEIRREAVGGRAGRVTLRISNRHPTLSSIVPGWPDRIGSASGFEMVEWDEEIEVPVVTMDSLIDQYGLPDFVKIDVEGAEAEILGGLSTAVPLVSFEYLPAAMDVADRCLDRLASLGTYEFNLVVGENQRFATKLWMSLADFRDYLAETSQSGSSGDVYARLLAASPRAESEEPQS
ncbi:FkbM family methyltransferase [Fulvimarina sp. 2208YS6-2-32]|uniref:FkbM family methyltransferase n=1 Tax=Fulvimarina uroteuthidis TaxID=3098149 RepID=A0ABU5I1Y3_9HYPH|nr:FkbM family methyltransferase [Fulvimarina sp. 2208YS6-2-32]MDY8109380.1 FkbM family methyltransferase [Fulvimarina sp. 2208YS6-2-32]